MEGFKSKKNRDSITEKKVLIQLNDNLKAIFGLSDTNLENMNNTDKRIMIQSSKDAPPILHELVEKYDALHIDNWEVNNAKLSISMPGSEGLSLQKNLLEALTQGLQEKLLNTTFRIITLFGVKSRIHTK